MGSRKNSNVIDRKCGDCRRDVFPTDRSLACATCKLPFHSNCVDVNKATFEKMTNKSEWICSQACKKKRDKQSNGDTLPSDPSNRDIFAAIKEVQKSQSFMSDKYDELVAKVDHVLDELRVAKCRIDNLEKENAILKTKMNHINTHKENDTQKDLNCNVIISGVSNDFNDVEEAFGKVSNVVDGNFSAADHVVKIERLFQQSTKEGGQPAKVIDKIPILVKFSSNDGKESFLKAAKKNKCIFTALECGLANDGDVDAVKNTKIIIKEHVNAANMRLLKEAKKLKEGGKVQFVWFQNSSVLIRKAADSKITKIKSLEDIEQFNVNVN